MSKDNGGPAFPVVSLSKMDVRGEGMTLRDYFAQGAMHPIIVAAIALEKHARTPKEIAAFAYEIADAMLAERNK